MRFSHPLLTLLASLALSSLAQAETLSCPSEIHVVQQLRDAPDGWLRNDSDDQHSFTNVRFSEDDPTQQFFLAPSKTSKQKGALVNVWNFTPSKQGYWLTCQYYETRASLVQKLPDTVSSCSVTYDMKSSVPLVKTMDCR